MLKRLFKKNNYTGTKKELPKKVQISVYKFHNNNHSKIMRNQIMLQNKLNEIIDYLKEDQKNDN